MKLEGHRESELLRRILPYPDDLGMQSWRGEDDAAVWPSLDPTIQRTTSVASCDTSVEDPFRPFVDVRGGRRPSVLPWLSATLRPGRCPKYALVGLAAPERVGERYRLYEGIRRLADRVDLAIAGGIRPDRPDPACWTLTVLGTTPFRPAGPGEGSAGVGRRVTGPLGAAAAHAGAPSAPADPKFHEGRPLNEAELCCGDVSDGLVREMEKFAAMSERAASFAPRVPSRTGRHSKTV